MNFKVWEIIFCSILCILDMYIAIKQDIIDKKTSHERDTSVRLS